MRHYDDAQRLARLLSLARYESGMSQEQMAMELQKSKNTIAAYEKGTSKPDIQTFLNWFTVLGKNPMPYILQYLNPTEFENIRATDPDSKIDEALDTLLHNLTPHQKRCVLYLLFGTYQGDPYAMMQLFVAHAHLPMEYRFTIANLICETYKLCEHTNNLKDLDHVMPDIQSLEDAIEMGKYAAINNQDGYSIHVNYPRLKS